ncbi:translational GTPase TypA [Candidatus Zinderia endosymbiont of Aphrophora alni]|uniref:translational GTPase TypA n=1 Tax=Candidatus Zinderia endosymbiont of Aphrophora alni TaxID=3077951 RepID=UPI0030D24E1A
MCKKKNYVCNIAIIAHIDHGKTTLIDQLLIFSKVVNKEKKSINRILDFNEIEKERGITIFSKNCSINYKNIRINIIDTPGHADFGGEVERVLSIVDGVLLLVDAKEGPMPQTKFVTKKALSLGLKPIVVINKIDILEKRVDWVVNSTFDLFDSLGATEEQLDFPIIYCSAKKGFANIDPLLNTGNMEPLLEEILKNIPYCYDNLEKFLQIRIIAIEDIPYFGLVSVGRIFSGTIKCGQEVLWSNNNLSIPKKNKIKKILIFNGLEKIPVQEAFSGDIILISGINNIAIGATICSIDNWKPLPKLNIDNPTISMDFFINNSPFSGKEGKFVTDSQIKHRLYEEQRRNISLYINQKNNNKLIYKVSGRGELHLAVLIEKMRREGFELSVSRPKVIIILIDGVKCEPFEKLNIFIEEKYKSIIMKKIGCRYGNILNINIKKNIVHLEYSISTNNLIGFHNEFIMLTKGSGLMNHIFEKYIPIKNNLNFSLNSKKRSNGVLISQCTGSAVAYSIWKLQERGKMFIKPNDLVYEGMIIGIHSRENDLVVNPIKCKQLTNIRASSSDEAIKLIPPIPLTIEYAINFINESEIIEITPKNIRLRKIILKENLRKKNKF